MAAEPTVGAQRNSVQRCDAVSLDGVDCMSTDLARWVEVKMQGGAWQRWAFCSDHLHEPEVLRSTRLFRIRSVRL